MHSMSSLIYNIFMLISISTALLSSWDPSSPPPPPPHLGSSTMGGGGALWSAKIDDISLWPPALGLILNSSKAHKNLVCEPPMVRTIILSIKISHFLVISKTFTIMNKNFRNNANISSRHSILYFFRYIYSWRKKKLFSMWAVTFNIRFCLLA